MFSLIILSLLIACGCSSGGDSPITPDISSSNANAADSGSSRMLWGMWNIQIDKPSGAIDIVPLRSASFNANVQHFLSPPFSPVHLMQVKILPGSDIASGFLLLEISFTHPFQGAYQFRGFDVRGIFMADGTFPSSHDPDIRYGNAQNNEAHLLNPDGYTRFWNATEFTDPMPLLSFKPGALGNDLDPSATLNPYKYFADDLDANGDVADLPPETRGVFSPDGIPRKRIYEIQFPVNGSPSILFNYAIDASWALPDPGGEPDYPVESFPPEAQCQEAYHLSVNTSGTTAWYEDGDSGGSVNLAIEVFDWQAPVNPSGVSGEVTAIWVESPVLASPINILPLATITPGTQTTSSVFEVELTDGDLNLTASGTFSLLGSVESADPTTYQPQLDGGDSFIYPDAPLAAYFMCTVKISGPVVDFTLIEPNGGEVWIVGTSQDILWTGGAGVENVKLEYSYDDFTSDIQEITASTSNTGSYNWNPIPDYQYETVKVRVSDATDPLIYDDSDEYFTITEQCNFTDAPTYTDFEQTDVVWSTGYDFMQIDSTRIVSCRPSSDGAEEFYPWLAVYNDSDYSAPVDIFQVPGWAYPYRPWCFQVDSNDRVFFFMDDEYPSDHGCRFDTIYYIQWNGTEFVETSLASIDISSWLDSGEDGGKIWMDSNDDLYVVTTWGKMIKLDHTTDYTTGEELFDLVDDPDYQQGKELGFFLAEDINTFFIYTGYDTDGCSYGNCRAIHSVSYDGTVLAQETDIWNGIHDRSGYISGGIAADGDCRLIAIDGHINAGLSIIRYDYALEQNASNHVPMPDLTWPTMAGNTAHFEDDGTIRFNTDAWTLMQLTTKLLFFDTPGDW